MTARVHQLKSDVDLIRELSLRAKATRKPGQTLQSRLNELRRQHSEFVAPPDHSAAPHDAGGAAIHQTTGGIS